MLLDIEIYIGYNDQIIYDEHLRRRSAVSLNISIYGMVIQKNGINCKQSFVCLFGGGVVCCSR